jgi:hypothetical protein
VQQETEADQASGYRPAGPFVLRRPCV